MVKAAAIAAIMASNNESNPTPKPAGLSLYANLLNPAAANSNATIAKAPVLFNQQSSEGNGDGNKSQEAKATVSCEMAQWGVDDFHLHANLISVTSCVQVQASS